MGNRNLYQCAHAHVQGDSIVCVKGHLLQEGILFNGSGAISIKRLQRGVPLEFSICQECPDYDEMGPPVPPKDRGWMTVKVGA